MRSFAILALVAVFAVAAVSAQSSTGASGSPSNPCERITNSMFPGAFTSSANQYKAVSAMVVKVAVGTGQGTNVGVFLNPITKNWFNGVYKYREGPAPYPFAGPTPDFTTNTNATNILVQHVASFFGPSLGCAVGVGYPAYSNTAPVFGVFSQAQIHRNMNISASPFSTFNNQVLAAAVSMGATADDGTAVATVLAAFGRDAVTPAESSNQICSMPDCPCANTVTGVNCDNASGVATTQASLFTLLAAAAVAVFAMRR